MLIKKNYLNKITWRSAPVSKHCRSYSKRNKRRFSVCYAFSQKITQLIVGGIVEKNLPQHDKSEWQKLTLSGQYPSRVCSLSIQAEDNPFLMGFIENDYQQYDNKLVKLVGHFQDGTADIVKGNVQTVRSSPLIQTENNPFDWWRNF